MLGVHVKAVVACFLAVSRRVLQRAESLPITPTHSPPQPVLETTEWTPGPVSPSHQSVALLLTMAQLA